MVRWLICLIRIITFRPEEKFEYINIKDIEITNISITKIVKLKFDLNSIINKNFDYIIFTSTLGAKYFMEEIKKQNHEEILKNKNIIAIGKKTAEYLNNDCIIPENQSSKGIIKLIEKNSNILLIRSKNGNPYLVKKLREIGNLQIINAYKSVIIDDKDYEYIYIKMKNNYFNAVIFTSSFIFRSYVKVFSKYGNPLEILPNLIIAIGERTGNTIKRFGIKPIIMEEPDIKLSVIKVIQYYNSEILF